MVGSCEKRVYRRMCEHPDGTRTGRYKKNEYYSVPKDAKKKASGTKKASKTTKNTKPKAKSVKKPVIDYEQAYDDHLDMLDAQSMSIPMNRQNAGRKSEDEIRLQKMYLQDQFSKRQASKRKKYSKPKAKSVKKPVSAKITKESNVRAWYVKTYPTDELGKDINPKLTFRTVASALHFGSDIYDVIGVGDSLIRERIFKKIASLYKVSYGEVYDTWLDQGRL